MTIYHMEFVRDISSKAFLMSRVEFVRDFLFERGLGRTRGYVPNPDA